jgi:Na+/proline symporter
MGKVLGIIIGIVLVVLGVWGIVAWWAYFVKALMAAVPALLIVVGVVLVVFFVSEIRSSLQEKAEMEASAEGEKEEEKTSSKKEEETASKGESGEEK